MNYVFRITETQEYDITISANNYDDAAKTADEYAESGLYQNETPSDMYVSNIKCIGRPEIKD